LGHTPQIGFVGFPLLKMLPFSFETSVVWGVPGNAFGKNFRRVLVKSRIIGIIVDMGKGV
jgi:hypothetical protein